MLANISSCLVDLEMFLFEVMNTVYNKDDFFTVFVFTKSNRLEGRGGKVIYQLICSPSQCTACLDPRLCVGT